MFISTTLIRTRAGGEAWRSAAMYQRWKGNRALPIPIASVIAQNSHACARHGRGFVDESVISSPVPRLDRKTRQASISTATMAMAVT